MAGILVLMEGELGDQAGDQAGEHAGEEASRSVTKPAAASNRL
jgi:hypothetical protein